MECFRRVLPVLLTSLIVIGVIKFGASVQIPKQWIPLLRDLCVVAQDG